MAHRVYWVLPSMNTETAERSCLDTLFLGGGSVENISKYLRYHRRGGRYHGEPAS